MRIGLLADLHANRQATEACLAALASTGCQRWVFLGDLVGYGADPEWTVDCVREYVERGALAVRGNHDAAIGAAAPESANADIRASIRWTRERLDPSQRAFLESMPLLVEDEDRLYVHASAWEPDQWAYVSNPLAAKRSLAATTHWLTLCGHVHAPALYYEQGHSVCHFEPRAGVAIPLSSQRRWLAIPGSCGQPRDGNPAASCAWFDIDTRTIAFLRVPYDHTRSAAAIRAAGLPASFADRLERGT